MKLSDNFKLQEALKSSTADRLGISNTPNAKQLIAIKHTATQMEKVRKVLNNKPISISNS